MSIITTITINEEIMEKLDEKARNDGRTRSNMINKILMDYFSREANDDKKDM